MSFLDDLERTIRERHPAWQTARTEDGATLRIAEEGRLGGDAAAEVHVSEEKGAVLLDWAWKLPLNRGKTAEVRGMILDYVEEAFENHGWEVPIVLHGGPLAERRLTKRRDDLAGRLMFARKGRQEGEPQRAHLYKWRLRRNEMGEYVCVYERSLEGEEVDRFIARGVDSTGPFVLIHDKA